MDKQKSFYESNLYAKYKDRYWTDKILREVFNCNIKLHRLYGLRTYSDVLDSNVQIMSDILHLYVEPAEIKDNEYVWQLINAAYIDPDGYAKKMCGRIECYADGLISKKRLYKLYGLSDDMIGEYKKYREIPIFFFPREINGINTSRAIAFGDRIDVTLFDLKNYFSKRKCRLSDNYKLPKTSEWLSQLGNFENLAEWYGIRGIFVDDNYEVFDIEKGGNSILKGYADSYKYEWSVEYLNNLKEKIDSFSIRQSKGLGEN